MRAITWLHVERLSECTDRPAYEAKLLGAVKQALRVVPKPNPFKWIAKLRPPYPIFAFALLPAASALVGLIVLLLILAIPAILIAMAWSYSRDCARYADDLGYEIHRNLSNLLLDGGFGERGAAPEPGEGPPLGDGPQQDPEPEVESLLEINEQVNIQIEKGYLKL